MCREVMRWKEIKGKGGNITEEEDGPDFVLGEQRVGVEEGMVGDVQATQVKQP